MRTYLKDDSLEMKLYKELISQNPDYDKCRDLINQGADLNAQYDEEFTLLGWVLFDYESPGNNCFDKNLEECKSPNLNCVFCPNYPGESDGHGERLIKTIIFFLENGYNLDFMDGDYGALALSDLWQCTTDKYNIEAIKILINAGAKIRLSEEGQRKWATKGALDESAFEVDFCYDEGYIWCSNYNNAVWHLLKTVEAGNPDYGISIFDDIVGYKIEKVFAVNNDAEDMVDKDTWLSVPVLYFQFEKGYMTVTKEVASWIVGRIPDGLKDVSSEFEDVLNEVIIRVDYTESTVEGEFPIKKDRYPIMKITFDSGKEARITIKDSNSEWNNLYEKYLEII